MMNELPSSIRIKRAVQKLTKMTTAERIQLMVKTKLLTAEQAQAAIKRVAKSTSQ